MTSPSCTEVNARPAGLNACFSPLLSCAVVMGMDEKRNWKVSMLASIHCFRENSRSPAAVPALQARCRRRLFNRLPVHGGVFRFFILALSLFLREPPGQRRIHAF